MPKKIKITAGKVSMLAELNDTKTAALIYQALPIKASANTWGDEIYFSIPVQSKPDNGVASVNLGDLGYWPPGNAFCIFFGQTPVSTATEIRPASPVNPIGKLLGNPKDWKSVSDGEIIEIVKSE